MLLLKTSSRGRILRPGPMTDPSRGEGAGAVADSGGESKVVRRVVRRVVETSPLLHSPSTWMLAFALLLTWAAVAVVMFDIVDLKVHLGPALEPDDEDDGLDEEPGVLTEATAAVAATDEHGVNKKKADSTPKRGDAAKGTRKKSDGAAGSGVKVDKRGEEADSGGRRKKKNKSETEREEGERSDGARKRRG